MCRRMFLLATVASVALGASGRAQTSTMAATLQFEIEAGPAWISRNDVRIPNNASATRFSLNDITGSGPFPAGRVYATWNINARHALRALAAPLSIRQTGELPSPVSFAGASFTTAAPIEATYVFNSYRLTYRYQVRERERTQLWVGGTAKVRDASVRLRQGTADSRKDDLGFVPLLHLAGNWRITPRWQIGTDIDALAGGPGRAIDAALRLGYDSGGRVSLHVGYRTVEGGADIDEVYSFAWVHYGVASFVWRW